MSLPDTVKFFVEARWKSPLDTTLLEKLSSVVTQPEGPSSGELVLWPVFENQEEPLQGRIAGLFGQATASRDMIAWRFSCIPAPASHLATPRPPPQEHLQISKQIGGFDGLRQLLNSSFGQDPEAIAAYKLEMRILQKDGWTCKLLHRDAVEQSPCVSDLGESGFVEQTGMRFVNGTNGLEEFTVVYFHSSMRYEVEVFSRAQLEWGNAFNFPNAEKIGALVLARIFNHQPIKTA